MQKMLWLVLLLNFDLVYAEICPDVNVDIQCIDGKWRFINISTDDKWQFNYGDLNANDCKSDQTVKEATWKHASYSVKKRSAFCDYGLTSGRLNIGSIVLRSPYHVRSGDNWYQLNEAGFFCSESKGKCEFHVGGANRWRRLTADIGRLRQTIDALRQIIGEIQEIERKGIATKVNDIAIGCRIDIRNQHGHSVRRIDGGP